MLFRANKTVLKQKNYDLQFSNVSFFNKKYENDCSICLQFPFDCVLINCNHTFCKICLKQYIEFFKKCPVCNVLIENVFDCKLVIQEEVKEFILFELVTKHNYKKFSSFYYLDNDAFQSLYVIYQVHDGQNYFLSNHIVREIIKNNKKLPKFIYGKIKNVYKTKYKCKEHFYFNHLLEGTSIFLVDIIS